MHFTNGETETRSGEAMYLGYSPDTGFSGWGVPRNLTEGPCRSQFLSQVESPLPMASDSITVPVPKFTALSHPMPNS